MNDEQPPQLENKPLTLRQLKITRLQRQALEWILEHPEALKKQSQKEIAANAGVSTQTLGALLKKAQVKQYIKQGAAVLLTQTQQARVQALNDKALSGSIPALKASFELDGSIKPAGALVQLNTFKQYNLAVIKKNFDNGKPATIPDLNEELRKTIKGHVAVVSQSEQAEGSEQAGTLAPLITQEEQTASADPDESQPFAPDKPEPAHPVKVEVAPVAPEQSHLDAVQPAGTDPPGTPEPSAGEKSPNISMTEGHALIDML